MVKVKTKFLQMVQIPNGIAKTIVDALCTEWCLDFKTKLCGLGSDGASVMLQCRWCGKATERSDSLFNR